MTLYADDRAVIANAEQIAAKAAKRKSRKIWALAAVGTLIAGGGAAFAAIQLQSNETEANLAKGTAANLVLENAEFTKPLFPGTSTGLKFRVNNSNEFPATVKQIVINGTSSTTCNPSQLSGPASTVGTVNGLVLTLASPVTVPAGEGVNVEYPKVVTLSPAATDSCAIMAKFKVTGEGAGSGN